MTPAYQYLLMLAAAGAVLGVVGIVDARRERKARLRAQAGIDSKES